MAFARAVSFLSDGLNCVESETVVSITHKLIGSQSLSQVTDLLLTAIRKRAATTSHKWSYSRCKTEGNAVFTSDVTGAIAFYTSALLARLDARERAVALANRSAAWKSVGFVEHAVDDAVAALCSDPSYPKAWYRLADSLTYHDGPWEAIAAQLATALISDSGVATVSLATSKAAALTADILQALSDQNVAVRGKTPSVVALLKPAHSTCTALETVAVRRGENGREIFLSASCGANPGDILLHELPVASVCTAPALEQADWLEIAKSGCLLVGSPVSERTPVDASGSAPGPSHARADDLASRSRCTHCLRSLPLMLICSGKCTSLDGGVRPGRRNDPTVIRARGCRCSLDDSRSVPYCIPCSGGCTGAAVAAWCSTACMLQNWTTSPPSGRGHWAECGSGVSNTDDARLSRKEADESVADNSASAKVWQQSAAVSGVLPAEVLLALRCMASRDGLDLEGPLDSSLLAAHTALSLPCAAVHALSRSPVDEIPLLSHESLMPRSQVAELAATAALACLLLHRAQDDVVELSEDRTAASPIHSSILRHMQSMAADRMNRLSEVPDCHGSHSNAAAVYTTSPGLLPLPPCPLRLARWLAILANNAHGVKVLSPHRRAVESSSLVVSFSEETVGLAIYARASFANHSCLPSALTRFDGRAVEVVALEGLTPGSTVTISYGPSVFSEPDAVLRSQWLRNRYAFSCRCVACSDSPLASAEAASKKSAMKVLFDRARDAAAAGDIDAAAVAQRAFIQLRESCIHNARLSACSGDRGRLVWQPLPRAELAHDLACLARLLQLQHVKSSRVVSSDAEVAAVCAAAKTASSILLGAQHGDFSL